MKGYHYHFIRGSRNYRKWTIYKINVNELNILSDLQAFSQHFKLFFFFCQGVILSSFELDKDRTKIAPYY